MAKTPVHPSVTVDRVVAMVERDEMEGICLTCGLDAYNVEPDARRYPCEACGDRRVYGAEELLMRMVA